MKKLFILGLVFLIISIIGVSNIAKADTTDTQTVKGAIEKYKNKNFLGCISDLRVITDKDKTNTVAWYYLGNAYMHISMKDDAHQAFDKVVSLNTVPKLTSYAIQAKLCMENSQKCTYQDFTREEIAKLRQNPVEFLDQYFENLNSQTKNQEDVEIEKLIDGGYNNNIHPEASEVILQERTKIEQSKSNKRAMVPNDSMNMDTARMSMLIEEHNNSEFVEDLSAKKMRKMMKNATQNF